MKLLLEQQGRAGFSRKSSPRRRHALFVTLRFSSYGDRDAGRAVDLVRRTSHEMSLKLAGRLSIQRCPCCGFSLRKVLAGIDKGFLCRLIDKVRSYSDD